MSLIGYTSGGSPIFSTNYVGSGKKYNSPKGKTLYECSSDSRHKLTKNQAKSSGYFCTHCGEPLKVRAEKLKELASLAKSLNVMLVYSK